MALPWILPAALAVLYLARRRDDETPATTRGGGNDETPPVRREGPATPAAAAADEVPPERRRRRRRRRESTPTVRAGDGSSEVSVTGLPVDQAQYVTRERVREAERGAVALALDAQRSGTGQPSESTIRAVQTSCRLPVTGRLDQRTRNDLALLLNSRLTRAASPARNQRHQSARQIAAAFLIPERAMAGDGAAEVRFHQQVLGVPVTGRLDQATGIAAVTELGRET